MERRLLQLIIVASVVEMLVYVFFQVPHVVESSSAMQALIIKSGEVLYSNPEKEIHSWVHPPFYYFILSLILQLKEFDPVLIGRLLNFTALLGVILFSIRIAKKNNQNVISIMRSVAWLLSAVLLLRMNFLSARCDAFASIFAFFACATLFYGKDKFSTQALAIFFSTLAIFSKQTLVWLPVLILFYIFKTNRKRIIGSVVFLLSISVLGLGLVLRYFGKDFYFYGIEIAANEKRNYLMSLYNFNDGAIVILFSLISFVGFFFESRESNKINLKREFYFTPMSFLFCLFFSSKMGARNDAFLPFIFTTFAFFSGQDLKLAHRRIYLEKFKSIIFYLVIGVALIKGFMVASDSYRSKIENDMWIADIASKIPNFYSGNDVFFVDSYYNLKLFNEFYPRHLEEVYHASVVLPGAYSTYFNWVKNNNFHYIVANNPSEYTGSYKLLEKYLLENGFRAIFSESNECDFRKIHWQRCNVTVFENLNYNLS